MFILISSSILLKSGAAPFHFWFPNVIEGLNWQRNLILITWQKIAPLIILSYIISFYLIIFTILISTLFRRLGGLNQTSLRKLISFSSINHLGWILRGILYRENLWLIYFFLYTILNFTIISIFDRLKLFNLNQTFKIFNSNIIIKLSIFINLLSLGGLPPFLGFLPKWLIIETIILSKQYRLIIIILFLTLITLYFYLRICYSALLINYLSINWSYKNFIFYKNYKIYFLTFTRLLGLIFINFIYLFL